ncbi:WD40 repeat-like protein [Lentinula novae-zelandiae]|nr:WD40 repeat-like protein [Lentinula novae-zelandiae]
MPKPPFGNFAVGMSLRFFPYSHLEIRSGIPVLAVSGFHIQVIDTSTGAVLFSTLNSPANVQESLKKSGPIRCAVLDNSSTHLATLADDKKLKVWKLDGLELLHERDLPKRPTSAAFTVDGQTIVVADKFGDVFNYPLHPIPPSESQASFSTLLHDEGSAIPGGVNSLDLTVNAAQPTDEPFSKKRKAKKQKVHENPPVPRSSLASHVASSNGTLVLGHTSLLTCFLLTPDNKYIVTADRDEHIRVSWYPQGFCIESFCLGHTQFVSAIHFPSDQPDILISGGGDAELKLWDWLSGKHKADISILDSVKPYIKVKMRPYKRTTFAKSAEKQKDQSREGTESRDSVPPDGEEQTVVAVQKISTLSNYILFTVTGGTALFAVACPIGVPSSPSLVHAVDFGKPVLDFTVAFDQQIWVNLDFNWSENRDHSQDGSPIRVVRLAVDGQPYDECFQLSDVSSTFSSPVLDALNGKCLVKGMSPLHLLTKIGANAEAASSEDLETLDFYSSLKSLPKNTGEYDGDEDGSGETAPPATGIPKNIKTNTRKQSQGPGGGKKEQGKLKSQKAVAQKKLESQSVLVNRGGKERDAPKRLKSEDPHSDGTRMVDS